MSEVVTTTPSTDADSTTPVSIIARLRVAIEAEAKAIGVDAEKLWNLVKEHM